MTWARKGECVVNDRWMPLNCRKACFTCEFNDTKHVTVKPSGSTTPTQPTHSPRTTRPTTRPPVITTVPTTRKPIGMFHFLLGPRRGSYLTPIDVL